MAQQDHWTERGRAMSVANADALGRPRRSVLSLAQRYDERAAANRVVRVCALSAHGDARGSYQCPPRCRRVGPYRQLSAFAPCSDLCVGAVLRLDMEAAIPAGGVARVVPRASVRLLLGGFSWADLLFPRAVFVCRMRTRPRANYRPGVDAGWRVLFAFQHLWPRATQAGRSATLADQTRTHM